MDVVPLHLEPGLDGKDSLPVVDLSALTEHPESQVDLHIRRKLGIFFGGRPTDLMLCLASSLLMRLEVVLTWGRKATKSVFCGGRCDSLRWVEGPSGLSVAVAVLLESDPETPVRCADCPGHKGSCSVHRRRAYVLFVGRTVVRFGVQVRVKCA
jgi:hypothetical protein